MANCLTRNRSETPSALKNCKQFFTDEEWNRARESSEALVNQLNLNNIVRYNTLINYMDRPVEITILGYHPQTIVGVVQHVVNNIDSSFVHLSPAWLEGVKKNSHLIHLEAIEKISPTTLPSDSVELQTKMQKCSLVETEEMLPQLVKPPIPERYPTPIYRPKPVFPSLSSQKGDDKFFTEEEMERTISQDDSISLDNEKDIADDLGCSRLGPYTTDQPDHNILYKIWIQHVATGLQEERQRSLKHKQKEQYPSVFLYAFTYLGFNIHYSDLARILHQI